MEILLLVITVVSLSISLFLAFAAWGMWREERARSAARVAALTVAADAQEPPAAIPRSAPWSAPAVAPLPEQRVVRHVPVPAQRVDERFLGSAVASPQGGRQRGLAIAAALLFVALSAGAYATFSGTGTETSTTAAATTGSPLELISLRHERRDGALDITGLVRNPTGGQSVTQLAAVALLFNQRGELVTSSRAGVDFTQLAPGDESPFVIRIDAPSNAARYRVSFRTGVGVVPHIDRRGQEPIARELP